MHCRHRRSRRASLCEFRGSGSCGQRARHGSGDGQGVSVLSCPAPGYYRGWPVVEQQGRTDKGRENICARHSSQCRRSRGFRSATWQREVVHVLSRRDSRYSFHKGEKRPPRFFVRKLETGCAIGKAVFYGCHSITSSHRYGLSAASRYKHKKPLYFYRGFLVVGRPSLKRRAKYCNLLCSAIQDE